MQTAKTSSIMGPPGAGLSITRGSDPDYPGRFLEDACCYDRDYFSEYVGNIALHKNAAVAAGAQLAVRGHLPVDVLLVRRALKAKSANSDTVQPRVIRFE
jgi:hypothetical protein